jgi:hypothetical protein
MSKAKRQIIVGAEWAYRDLLICLMVTFLAVATLALTMVPVAKNDTHAGRLIVQLFWDNKIDADVDLWVKGPDEAPIGFSNRTGKIFDLLHDHRGYKIENDWSNTEYAVARSLPEGKYTINAVMFSSWDGVFPVHVWAVVTKIKGNDSSVILKMDGFLKADKDEITIANFRVDENENIIQDSINNTKEYVYGIHK